MWYEMCTVKQATEPEEDTVVTASEITSSSFTGGSSVKVQKDETVSDILKKIERKLGVPPTKIMRLEDSFKTFQWYNGKTLS